MADVVVLGGGPTGLATAMLFAQQGLDTVVLDRDEGPPDDPEKAWEVWERRSVTHFRQAHLLLAGGFHLLREHLPGVVAELEAVGAIPLNVDQRRAALLPGGSAGIDFGRFATMTCRRPLIDYAFAAAARATPGVEMRHGCAATELLTGPAAIEGVPHVVGVRTDAGEAVPARLVVDATGRRSPLGAMLEAVGGRRPEEHHVEAGFQYQTQFYRSSEVPEMRCDSHEPMGSFSVLTLPADHGWWSVTLYHGVGDKLMRRVRDRRVFERVLRSLPLHAHWVDGEPQGPVASLASTANATRRFVADGRPCATGVVPVGDAWGFTNPSVGRGITMAVRHSVDVVAAVAAQLDDPLLLAEEWAHATDAGVAAWHASTVDFDRIRGPEVDAARRGEPDPFDPDAPAVAGSRALASASRYDAQVLEWFAEVRNAMSLPGEVFSRPGARERIFDVAASNPPHRAPGPDRAELEALLRP